MKIQHHFLRPTWAGMSCLLAVVLFAACAPTSTATPAPTPEAVWLKVQYPGSLGSLSADFTTCVPEGVGLAVQEAPGIAFSAAEADLTLGWAAPEAIQGYAAELGSEELVVVVHPQNTAAGLDMEDLSLIYSGEVTDWDLLGQSPLPLHAWAFPAGNDAWVLFSEAVLEPDLTLGREVATAPSPRAMLDAVAADPGAIGFLPRRWVDATVQVIPVTDLADGALTRPILAFSFSEPQGAARAWLACLQERIQ